MVQAELVRYLTTKVQFLDGPHKSYRTPEQVKAIYVPSEKILVIKDASSLVIIGPLDQRYRVLRNQEAQNAYCGLLNRYPSAGITPEQIEVSDTFVDWAKAVYLAKNPPKEISDLLK